MSIKLEKPIKLYFDEIEIDDHVPSIKFNVEANIKQFSHLLQYQCEIWIECSSLDKFLNELVSKSNKAVLNDMGESFSIEIRRDEGGVNFLWTVNRKGVMKDIIKSSYCVMISEDILLAIQDQFTSYQKWW